MATTRKFNSITFHMPRPVGHQRVQCHVYVPPKSLLRPKDLVCALRFINAAGEELAFPVSGYALSSVLKAHYKYVPDRPGTNGLYPLQAFDFPAETERIQLQVIKWRSDCAVDLNSLRLLTQRILPHYNGEILQQEAVLRKAEATHERR